MQTIRLTKGLGKEGKKHCVMAATSIVADEKFTDRPKCVCPVITSALIELNDSFGDDDFAREEALGHLPWLIIGTRGDFEHERERAFLFADWAVRVCCGIDCEPITDRETARAAVDLVHAAHATSYATYGAADAAHAADVNATAQAAHFTARAAWGANRRQDLIAYIELIIIPIYTTMKVEPGFRNEYLITEEINL